MFIEMGNLYYIIYIIISIAVVLSSVWFLKNKSKTFRFWFIFGFLIVGFVFHFAKIFIYPYNSLSTSVLFRKISLENISAVSTVFFPFIYLSKNKVLKDYMIIGGMIGGISAILFPIDAISSTFDGMIDYWRKPAFSIDVIRFYYIHIMSFLVPFLMMHFKMHEFDVKRIYKVFFVFIGVLTIVFLNELLITLFGWVSVEELFQYDSRNPSFIFGIKPEFESKATLLLIFVPKIFKFNPFTGNPQYWPIIWMIIPIFIYGSVIILAFQLIYNHKQVKDVFFNLTMNKNCDSSEKNK